MITDLDNLPSDTASLHGMIFALDTDIKQLAAMNKSLVTDIQLLADKNHDLAAENQTLKEQLELLKSKRFGKSSEKLDKQIEELELQIEENEIISWFKSDIDKDKITNEPKNRPKRQKLPDHLPREDIVLNPEAICQSCGSEEFRKIEDDISETLEYIPSSFKVIRHIRPRCVCINCEQIVQDFAPSKTIDKGKAGPGLLAHILVQKYCNHLPLYRQSQIYERESIELSRSTMAGWAGECASLLRPITAEIQKYIFSSGQIHGDDTPVKVLAPGLGKTKTGRIWTYVLDSRPYGDKSPPAVCYFYSPDRKGIRPQEHMKDFTGILHADAYSGYDHLYNSDHIEITEAACWAHTRRKFYEVIIANDKASIAASVLEQISEIYKIEAEIKGLDPDRRVKVRQDKSKALVEKLFTTFKKALSLLPKKSLTVKAINYALNNEVALKRFLDNGKIEIDNNAAERAMRSIALGRKNWLFAGSDNGGSTAAAIYTIIETARLNGINPWKYLYKVLDCIQDYNSRKITELLPWNIKLE